MRACTTTSCGVLWKPALRFDDLRDHEASLEDLFIVIMERLGYGVKRTDDLGQRGLDARSVDVPSTTEGWMRELRRPSTCRFLR